LMYKLLYFTGTSSTHSLLSTTASCRVCHLEIIIAWISSSSFIYSLNFWLNFIYIFLVSHYSFFCKNLQENFKLLQYQSHHDHPPFWSFASFTSCSWEGHPVMSHETDLKECLGFD